MASLVRSFESDPHFAVLSLFVAPSGISRRRLLPSAPMPHSRHAVVVLVLVLAAALLASACGNGGAGKRSLHLAECRLPNVPTAAQCGELLVPEDRAQPGGRKIRLFAAVLPANTVTPKDDPLVILAGGPGQAASFLGPFAARLTELRRTRDVVLIDQRGTGRSSPLSCAAFKPRDDDAFDVDPLPRARECVAELKAQGVDAAQYTTTAWIADLEAMREALGYARWNLWGGSYGSRVAQEYLRRHPERVRTLTLDGVAPPGLVITLDVWRTRAAALTALFDGLRRLRRLSRRASGRGRDACRRRTRARPRRPRHGRHRSADRRDAARARHHRRRAGRAAAADLRARDRHAVAGNARRSPRAATSDRCSRPIRPFPAISRSR